MTAHPLVILIGMFLFVRKPNRLELIGGIAAFSGAAISMLDAGDVKVTALSLFLVINWRSLERSLWLVTSSADGYFEIGCLCSSMRSL